VSLEGRTLHLTTLLQEADQRVSELQTQQGGEGEREGSERERQLKAWGWRQRLFTRMRTGFQHASPPDQPVGVSLSVTSSSSLRVDFQEPSSVNAAVVTKYKVGWSMSPCMSPLLGETLVEDTTQLSCDITSLKAGSYYYIQVWAYNMKGWGPPCTSTPTCAAPSSWREMDGRAPRHQGHQEALDRLLFLTKEAHRHCSCHEQCKAPPHGRKHSVSKSLRHLFQPTTKFVRNLKRGLYLTTIFYRDDNVLVTPDDQIPVVEVEDAFSSSLMQDFLWFTKVSYLWEDILWLQQCLSPSQTSCTLQTRVKMLQAVSLLQGMLGVQDLGQAYFEPIKDKQGNALLVLLRDMSAAPALDGVHWTPLCKLQLQRKSISSPEEPTALDTLLITLHEKLAYHRRSRKQLSPGLYLGYLKLCTSMDQIRALVPQKLPNVLCHSKIRDNANVSREEWQWLRALTSLEESLEMDADSQSAPHRLLQELRSAAKDLLAHINMPGNQAQDFRLYTEEVVELGVEVSLILLLPPSDQVCTAPGQNNPFSPRSGFLTLPLQIFELVHFGAYCPAFIGQYCRVSALLELESLMSQQALREAFSESELHAAKQKHQQVQEHVQHMEEIWREARWIMDALQFARYKQSTGGVSLAWVIDFNNDGVPDKPVSTSSQLDYMPSPAPSPEPCRKHPDFHGLSDEEGSSEVFLTTDSDYDSSRAQSPRELDLLPASPLSAAPPEPRGYLRSDGSSSGGGGDALRISTPDVLQGSESGQCGGGGGGGGGGGCGVGGREGRRRGCGPELFDSDFILPSRQIELLRITEKRQAYCVRTSSLEFPSAAPPPNAQPHPPALSPARSPPHRRWARPSSVDRCHGTDRSPRQPPARTLSEDSGTERLSALSPGDHRRGWPATLRVYPQYPSGLPKDTSVKLRVTPCTSAREIVQLVVQEMKAASRRMLAGGSCGGGSVDPNQGGGSAPEQLQLFGLVLAVEGREKWLQDDFCPLELQNPWQRGKLCVRVKEYSPLAPKHSRATTV
ncbi:ankyrin repeat and fibronectin type-III domain-containing protein 1-like, partial [Gadus chalcogrammus]|uniref:ankyrin repeat and fibronectin type-III domain-containing protein 1-like n=1 Tax=Gadus chalcogrammus TaxID=1042646 RepID=UPI0024C33ADB